MKPAVSMEEILKIVRIDGGPESPFAFLTIEDGGRTYRYPKEILDDSKKGLLYGNFKPGEQQNIKDLGVPGRVLPMIMSCLVSSTRGIDDWEEYAENRLYKGNECNLKFYPLGRPNQNSWARYKEITGHEVEEYLRKCESKRPKLIFNHKGLQTLVKNAEKKHFIIAAACRQWMPFMNLLFTPDTMGPSKTFHSKDVANENNKDMVYRFYFRKDGHTLAYAYINMFRQPLLKDHIKEFAGEYLKAVQGSGKIPIPS